jgi:ribosomal protein S18 acetylase RimI-like enzyme
MRTEVRSIDEMPAGNGEMLPFVRPENVAYAVVVSDDGEVIGRLGVYSITYYEDVWIAPEHRANLGVVRALLNQAAALPQVRGERWVFVGAGEHDKKMQSYLSRLGKELAVRAYCISVGGKPWHIK